MKSAKTVLSKIWRFWVLKFIISKKRNKLSVKRPVVICQQNTTNITAVSGTHPSKTWLVDLFHVKIFPPSNDFVLEQFGVKKVDLWIYFQFENPGLYEKHYLIGCIKVCIVFIINLLMF